MSQNIVYQENVRRYYGEKSVLSERYEEMARSGRCPFCLPHIQNEFVGETAFWNIVHNQFPYNNSKLHLFLLPKRHIVNLDQMGPAEWANMPNALRLAFGVYPFLRQGYGLAVRDGKIGGVTLYHLHWHLIAPEIGPDGQIPVSFGIG